MTDTKTQTDNKADSNRLIAEIGKLKGPAPVHLWNPPYCGEIDIRIARDGTWYHNGSRITRPRLVALFSSVLRLEEDGQYCLVTPVERMGIKVDDCPFVAKLLEVEEHSDGQTLNFVLNTGERVTADAEHKIKVESIPGSDEPHPIVHVRRGLNALISRNVFYDLVNRASTETKDGVSELSISSAGVRFSLGQA
ncbi:MAG: DUF1285 domain-containing protein [Pseudohongiellaceae bacterium]|nr:DUF1285 domain-containing protein [Pseudohongiellaceae bacterium]